MEFWSQFEEQVLDGKFPLEKYLGPFETGALCLSQRSGDPEQHVAVKIVGASAPAAQRPLAAWNLAKGWFEFTNVAAPL